MKEKMEGFLKGENVGEHTTRDFATFNRKKMVLPNLQDIENTIIQKH